MKVTLCMDDGIQVQVECDSGYSPDILDDLCQRARDLFAGAHRDLEHLQGEHE